MSTSSSGKRTKHKLGELRQQLFQKSRRRNNRSRSRSCSPCHRNYDEQRSVSGQRGDSRHHDRGWRPRSRSPGRRSGHSKRPGGRRKRSPLVRENSAERRAKTEQWNKEREDAESGGGGDHRNSKSDDVERGNEHDDGDGHSNGNNNRDLSKRGNGGYDF